MTFAICDFGSAHFPALPAPLGAFAAADIGREVAFLAAGTEILTHRGPVAIEALGLGDLVLTADHGYQPLRWIGQHHVTAEDLLRQPELTPIRLARGALGPQQPLEDLVVSAAHRLLLRGPSLNALCDSREALVAARDLLSFDGVTVACETAALRYYQLLFDCHEIIFANGAMTESMLPAADRHVAAEIRPVAEISVKSTSAAKTASGAKAGSITPALPEWAPQPATAAWHQDAPCGSARPVLSRAQNLPWPSQSPRSQPAA